MSGRSHVTSVASRLAAFSGLAVALAMYTAPSVASAGQDLAGPATYRAVLDRYCVACHNERLQRGALALDAVPTDDIGTHAELWEKVLQKLQTQSMPPPGRPRPDETDYGRFASWLETELDHAATVALNPGRPTIHRLNRLEYANAVRDLLGLEVDGDTILPGDDLAYGFDNNADILTISPGLLERYMSAARAISRLAVEDPSIEPDVARYNMSALGVQDDRMSEDLPFGSRGGTAVRHYFPLDAEYVVSLRLGGNAREHQEMDVRLDGARVALLDVGRWPEESGRTAAPLGGDGALTLRFPATAGSHTVQVSFVKRNSVVEGVAPSRLPVWTFGTGRGFVGRMALESMDIAGPFAPDTVGVGAADRAVLGGRSTVFTCRPTSAADEARCADEILGGLARRAFRRPVASDDVAALRAFFDEGRRVGGFRAGIQRALEMMLVDPEFLFRLERDPADVAPATAYRLSDVELASRLSFFLWSSIPDEELLAAAEAGRLGQPAVLEAQVRRMLADERSNVLVSNFGGQWLHLRRMRTVTPESNAFPGFDDSLRDALVRETELFIESQFRADRSVVDLLTADYTFVNERLARHYGIEGVYGSRFRRVTWNDEKRRGLLGHGSILTVTSLATRTSPVVRGKWVLENILGTPPPPPPPDVPALPDRVDSGELLSMRTRMESHRANPVCASCHSRMDPLGFALEHFDAVGRWREHEAGNPIDDSGVLPDGTTFDGLPALRQVLFERRGEFVTTVTEKLLTYALGRGVEYYDRPAIRAIVREAKQDDYRWSSLVLALVRSQPFQMRRSES
ncbi:MAG: DUF1592 domain-containing protein [Vicinamibacterales bacterium]|nr:DUF1592 domain-containing protein [Vicinamibacterales bacterium]